jgi:magnesium transporter
LTALPSPGSLLPERADGIDPGGAQRGDQRRTRARRHGNAGSQASTLVIRALALGEISLRDWWRVARRELAAGLVLGGLLGAVGLVRIAAWSAFTNLYGHHWLIGPTVGVAPVGVVLWGALVGSMLPFGLRRLGFDPATSSAHSWRRWWT